MTEHTDAFQAGGRDSNRGVVSHRRQLVALPLIYSKTLFSILLPD
jgi:hypothetical protein